MATTAPIYNCPAEIFGWITKGLPTSDLLKLCRVSSRMRQAAEAILYSKLEWKWQVSWEFSLRSDQLPLAPPIELLVRTLLHRPELGAQVRVLVLDGTDPVFRRCGRLPIVEPEHEPEDELEPFSPPISLIGSIDNYIEQVLDDTELGMLVKTISDLELPQDEQELWIQEMHRGSIDAFAALLLLQTPNIRYLKLGEAFSDGCDCICMVLRWALYGRGSALPSPPLFRSVTKLIWPFFDTWDTSMAEYREAHPNTACVLGLFYIPQLEELAAYIDNPTSGALEWPVDHPPNLSKLQSLDINFLREGHLAQILALTTQLKTLRWNWWYHPQADSQFVNLTINLDNIMTALSHVKRTLTHLALTTSVWPAEPESHSSLKMTGSLAALATFNSLKTLEIPAPLLFGSLEPPKRGAQLQFQSCLPQNLETLRVTDFLMGKHKEDEWGGGKLAPIITSWMEDWRSSTPHLRRFQLFLNPTNGARKSWQRKRRQELALAAVQAGLEFEIYNGDKKLT
ncbi:hypothetical protein B0T19DRAFT_413625 [Cercophora scortea]|uniref:F-box domain-containing protein n=1 Tax=Cercophora scortea TaxID=314031 RepID=A0AAE0IUT8_9PEZI|nr:hypothetical protein B0T19DRAFT_413625 [Cercophora scortea]